VAASAPTQQDVEQVVERASKRILRFLQRRGVITLVTAPGDGEVTVVSDETMGEKDPLLTRLLAAATAGASPAGPAHKRAPVRIVLDPDAHPVAKGKLWSAIVLSGRAARQRGTGGGFWLPRTGGSLRPLEAGTADLG
jgi:hypothetical protein